MFHNSTYILDIVRPILTKFRQNHGIVTGNKNVFSDLENIGQGHNLQKLLYLIYYTTDFYQTFIEIMEIWPETKIYC